MTLRSITDYTYALRVGFGLIGLICMFMLDISPRAEAGVIANSASKAVKAAKAPLVDLETIIEECKAQKFDTDPGCHERAREMTKCLSGVSDGKDPHYAERARHCKEQSFPGLKNRGVLQRSVPVPESIR